MEFLFGCKLVSGGVVKVGMGLGKFIDGLLMFNGWLHWSPPDGPGPGWIPSVLWFDPGHTAGTKDSAIRDAQEVFARYD